MSNLKVKIIKNDGTTEIESLYAYCSKISKRNNSILYKLENYLGMKLLDEPDLVELRDIILTVSADVSKISQLVICGDEDEGL
ncbi:MAG: hypothetical protein ABTA16_09865 [Niallia sp.]